MSFVKEDSHWLQIYLKLNQGCLKSPKELIIENFVMLFNCTCSRVFFCEERLKNDANVTNIAGWLPLHHFHSSMWMLCQIDWI